MVFTVEYKRTIRVRPYETVTIGGLEEFRGNLIIYDGCYRGLKEQVDKWIEEAREEFADDEHKSI